MKKITRLLAIFVWSILIAPFATNAQSYLDDIMFQSFGWDEYNQSRVACGFYNFYNQQASYMKSAGFDMIWFPPASQSTGGVGYIPTKLYNFSQTSWGTEAELKTMLATYNGLGMYPIADIVVNHRGGTTSWTDFTEPTWGCETIAYNDDGGSLHTATYVGCKPAGANDTGDDFSGGRDLDHTNATVQSGVKQYLTLLKELGFKGWRWDVAKGFSATYFGEYNKASTPYYSVGEYWDGNTTTLKNWIDGTGNAPSGTTEKSGAFDFANYYQLSTAVRFNSYGVLNSSGKMPGIAGQIGYDNKAVTFVDNHDTFTKTEAILDNNIMKGYAYILTHPGIPCVWAPHYFGGSYTKEGVTRTYTDNQTAINKLMAVRKANGINAYSYITINQSSSTYAAYVKKSFSDADPVIAVKIGSGAWTPTGSGWILNVSGTDYSVWSKKEITTPAVASSCGVTISLIGDGVSDWETDVPLSTTDNKNYTLSNYNFIGGGVKFRANNSWSVNWGGTGFPTGTGVKASNDNIPVVAGKYSVSFNIESGAYSFTSGCTCPTEVNPVCANGVQYTNACVADCAGATGYTAGACPTSVGIIGTAVTGWVEDVDMTTSDGISYTLDYPLVKGEMKFRKDNKWTENWGGTYPSGTGVLNSTNNIAIPSDGNYIINFNLTTKAFSIEPSLNVDSINSKSSSSISLYPNPSNNDWNLKSDETVLSVKLIDRTGKEIASYSPSTKEYVILGSNLAPGLYFAVVTTANATQTIKLVKE